MFGVLGWIIFGLIVGAIAKLVMPGRDPGGIIITMALGIAGALVGGFLGRALGWYGPNDGAGFFMSLIGAVLLLWLYRMMVTRRTGWKGKALSVAEGDAKGSRRRQHVEIHRHGLRLADDVLEPAGDDVGRCEGDHRAELAAQDELDRL